MSVSRTHDIALCQSLRASVFTDEQGVSQSDEVDGADGDAVHFLADLDGKPVGTARILLKGDTAKIGRVCVLKDARGTHQGHALMIACIEWARANDFKRCVLGAQLDAMGFYEKLGFVAFGDVFDDAGIDHRNMEMIL